MINGVVVVYTLPAAANSPWSLKVVSGLISMLQSTASIEEK